MIELRAFKIAVLQPIAAFADTSLIAVIERSDNDAIVIRNQK